MFWRFGGYANISSIDSLLDKPDVTLEEVLDESDTISELKGQNAKLIDFLREENILKQLMAYVTADPKQPATSSGVTSTPEKLSTGVGLFKGLSKGRSKSRGEQDETEKEKAERQRMKYAYVSCEILSSDVWSLSESILENTAQLRPFWDFLKTDAPLDNLQAGYFTKVNEALIEKQPARMVSFVKTLDNMIPNMMKHVDCPMIMDLLLKLISLEKDAGGQGIVDWMQTQKLIPTLVSFISPDYPAATQTAAGDFLKAIITISANATGTDQTVIGPNELTRELVSEESISSLLKEMLKGGNSLTVGVGIVIEVIRKNNSDYDSESQAGPEPKSSDPIYLGNLLRLFAHAVPHFMDILHNPKHTIMTEKGSKRVDRADLRVAWGKKIEPLGFDRFKTCELMAELLHCSNMALLNEKGAEAEVKKRDAEREKLKAEGKLASAMNDAVSGEEFGRSVDSSGFHHAEPFSPLGESPEKIKQFEMQMQNNNEDDGFEKVALDDADIDAPMDDLDEKPAVHNEYLTEEEEHAALTEKIDDLNVEDDLDMTDSSNETSGHGNDDQRPLSHNPATEALAADIATPPPLFAKRNTTEQPPDTPSPFTQANIDLGARPASSDAEQYAQNEEEVPGPGIQREDDGEPVLGDLLKMQFVEHHVVPTILDFFFRFPWNNFLHNVVYDVVQQVFNGAMDRGYNRNVCIDLFETGRVTDRVIEGQDQSDQSQKENKMRLGYMGHLTLIAEEIVKFTERQAPEALAGPITDKVMDPSWIYYVEHTLAATRERDNAILGGVRPDPTGGPRQAVLNAVAAQNSFANAGSQALANAGLTGGEGGSPGLDSMDLVSAGAAPGYNLNNNPIVSGFGSSDEDDEDDLEDKEASEHLELTTEPESAEQIDLEAPNNASSMPAPLAFPATGSRARRQLAAILADKKRNANINPSAELDDTNDRSPDLSNPPPRPAPLRATRRTKSRGKFVRKRRSHVRFGDDPGEGLSSSSKSDQEHDQEDTFGRDDAIAGMSSNAGFAEDFKGFDVDSDEGLENITDDDDDVPHADILSTLRKMSVRTPTVVRRRSSQGQDTITAEEDEHGGALAGLGLQPFGSEGTVERRALSDGSDDDLDIVTDKGKEPSMTSSTSSTSEHGQGQGQPTGAEKGIGGRTPAQTTTMTATESPGDHEAEMLRKKKEEQQRLLEQWGLASDDVVSDDDDPPVEMKRSSSSSSSSSSSGIKK